MGPNVLGISALFHDAACCILKDGTLVGAVQQERFSRKKGDPSMPVDAFFYCLKSGGLGINDIDCVAYYEHPQRKLARQLWSGLDDEDKERAPALDPKRPEREIRELLGYEGPIQYVGHHLSHAASAFYYSNFDEAAVMTVDGVGEWATTTYGVGRDERIEIFEEVDFPDSIGLFYATLTSYLGFSVNSGEYKVMGLAPYGTPVYRNQLEKMIAVREDGGIELDMQFYEFIHGERMYSQTLIDLLGQPPRVPDTDLSQFHKDVASSLQHVLEGVMLDKVRYLHRRTRSRHLCLAGGVALNCVCNARVLKDGPFEELYVQPAAGDAGCCLGAAAVAHVALTGRRPRTRILTHVGYGPEYGHEEIGRLLRASPFVGRDYRGRSRELVRDTARLLADGNVIGWFQGRMEFGPRALGARSILADPRNKDMRERLNSIIKKREAFRPFAPAVLEEKMGEHFDLDSPSPFMLRTCQVKSHLDLPAVTHIDGSARVQTVDDRANPLFAALIREFGRLTGCPLLLNTSFNVRDEPIVMSPVDALRCFVESGIDCLVLADFLIKRSDNPLAFLKCIVSSMRAVEKRGRNDVYTFL